MGYVGGGYTYAQPNDEAVATARLVLADRLADFDTFVGTGASGALIAPALAYAFEKHCVIVRKRGAHQHTSNMLEGYMGERYVIVDDFVDTGRTLARILREVGELSECVGGYFYSSPNYWDRARIDDRLAWARSVTNIEAELMG